MEVVERLEGPPPSPPNRTLKGGLFEHGETEASKRKHKEWEIHMAEWRLYHELKGGAN